MNSLKGYADQVQLIIDEMKSGKLSMAQAVIELQAVAVLAGQDASEMEGSEYAGRLEQFADMIYAVIEKMDPKRRVLQ
ncbi:hypothetical protein [Maridesulfovibrio sp.]|uniref:hypothetical protein n=1 Tax=Maridesulfovibrio sp. TaxID=2795000 RepID=UPI002A18B220|nr:hypothetical protein [Maridesulfovibrio sp.]